MAEKTTTVSVAALNPFTVSFQGDGKVASQDELIRYLMLGQPAQNQEAVIAQRIDKLLPITNRLRLIPGNQQIRDKLATPLMHAYGAFLVGNFLGSIALCGTICEMLAIFSFECSNVTINNNPLTEDEQKKLFGRTIEKLGQERRVEILEVYKILPESVARAMHEVREIRRHYLHLWSKDHGKLEEDAAKVFERTIGAVLHFFPQTFDNGKIVLETRVMKYLEKVGAITPTSETSEAG